MKRQEYVTVYCHRNSIEPYYGGEAYVAKLQVEKKFIGKFVKSKGAEDLQHWLDYYNFDDTRDLYERASKAKAIKEIIFEKPKVLDNLNIRSLLELAYNAMRMLEIIGMHKAAEEMYSGISNNKVNCYASGRNWIRGFIDVEVEKNNVITKLDGCVYAKIGKEKPLEIMLVTTTNEEMTENLEVVVYNAYNEWIEAVERDDEVGQIPLVDYIEMYMNRHYIHGQLFVKKGTEVEHD